MKRIAILTTVILFFLVSISQAVPLSFEIVSGTSNVILAVSADAPSGHVPLHQMSLSIQSFVPQSASISLISSTDDLFANIEAFATGGNLVITEDEEASGLLGFEFKPPVGATISLSNPEVRSDNSFDLLINVIQTEIGTSAYMFHWDTGNQPIEFEDVNAWLNPSAPNQLLVDFDLVLAATGDIDSDSPIFTTTVSGEFTAVPEPTSIFLLGTGLVGLGVFRRKFRK